MTRSSGKRYQTMHINFVLLLYSFIFLSINKKKIITDFLISSSFKQIIHNILMSMNDNRFFKYIFNIYLRSESKS